MPEDIPSPPALPAQPTAPATLAPIPFNIGEEFGTAKKNLPPTKIVLIALGAVIVIVGLYSLLNRAKPQGGGEIDNVAAIEVPGQNLVLVALTVTLRNTGRKALWIHDMKGTLKTASGEFSDDAASVADFDRYFEAFPDLKRGALPALMPETKLPPGAEARGTIIVSFPVTKVGFDQRQSVSAIIQPYDQPVPVVLTQ